MKTEMSVSSTTELMALRENRALLRWLILVSAGFLALCWIIGLIIWFAGNVAAQTFLVANSVTVVGLAMYGLAAWFVSRRQTIPGRWWLFLAMITGAVMVILLFGGVDGARVVVLLIPMVGAGLLGSGRDTLTVSLAGILTYLGLLLAEQYLGLQSFSGDNRMLDTLFFVLTVIVISTLAWLSSRDLSRALAESQSRAEELLLKTEQLMEKNIQQVELGSDLAAAAAELQANSQQQAGGASEQASAVTEVSTTIEELGSTARQIAQAAEHVAEAAHQTLEQLSSGQDAVDESIQAMERIRQRVQDISTRVLSLGERSQQIGEIIDLIDDISDETHLLALNAAIEAAGAGEYGRRFAVVAAEVKSLANRTLAAAKEVKGVIAEIRQATSAAVLAAEEGSKEVERGVELAHRAGQVMDNIVMVAERTAQAAAEIGLATAQQQSASEQVVETMREIAEVARQSALSARHMAESAARLTAIAARLHGLSFSDDGRSSLRREN
ncbi:methyl-accepting chemotaxis protein [Chloroflexus sp.]|uniref:methyl-accepting chemotaxis protein n=1 Tax=Chloroflexus sp. TaxID=1904827 RepID=UPI0026163501|nr:methyl-accepting chemotaxis protein [uncultured Chloroflexus sp.]